MILYNSLRRIYVLVAVSSSCLFELSTMEDGNLILSTDIFVVEQRECPLYARWHKEVANALSIGLK